MNWKVILGFGLFGAWLYVGFFRPDIEAAIQVVGMLGGYVLMVVAVIFAAGQVIFRFLRARAEKRTAVLGRPVDVQRTKTMSFGNMAFYLIAATVLFFYFGLHFFVPEIYRGLTGLRGDDFVSDYMEASTERALDFQRNICGDITCYTELDYLCGFSIGGNEKEYEIFREAFDECFYGELRLAHPRDYLGEIVLRCGRENMYFDPAPSELVNPESCEANGGVWGVPSPDSG